MVTDAITEMYRTPSGSLEVFGPGLPKMESFSNALLV